MNGAQPALGQWTTGLCGCCQDPHSCCCSCFCPCVPVGKIINVLDEGQTSCCEGGSIFCLLQYFTGLGCLYSCIYRKKLRMRYDLPKEPCNDVCTSWCCLCCSIAQAYRELNNRNVNAFQGYVPTVTPTAPPAQFMQKA